MSVESVQQQQREIIKSLYEMPVKEGQQRCVIDAAWFRRWKDFVHYHDDVDYSMLPGSTHGPPNAVDNSALIDYTIGTDVVLKMGIQEHLDFFVIPMDAYRHLVSWYGGGPRIVRKIVSQPPPHSLKSIAATVIARHWNEEEFPQALNLPVELNEFIREVRCKRVHLRVEIHPIIVKLLNGGRSVKCLASPTDRLWRFAHQVSCIFNIAPHKMKLWKKDKRTGCSRHLCDKAKTLNEYGIKEGARIRVDTTGDLEQLNRQLLRARSSPTDILPLILLGQVNDHTLNCAFQYGDRGIVYSVIRMGAGVNEETLNIALRIGDPVFVQRALALGATGNERTLCCALMNGNPRFIEQVLKLGRLRINEDTLNCAILTGDIGYVRKVLELGGTANPYSIACVHHVNGSDCLLRCVHEAAVHEQASQSAFCWEYLDFLTSTYGKLDKKKLRA